MVGKEQFTVTLSEVAQWVGAELDLTAVGEGYSSTSPVLGASPLRDVRQGEVTLADDPKHIGTLNQSTAVAAIVGRAFPACSKPLLRVDSPHAAFSALIMRLRPAHSTQHGGISPQAIVDASARIGEQCSIAAGVTIGAAVEIGNRVRLHAGCHVMAGCKIGDDCELFPGVVLYPETILENRVLIHAGAILGAYGFGYRNRDGKHIRTAQLGWVHIESDVEIGAGTTIDRGTYGATRIGEGTKIDNQVQIAHNCSIGKHNLICAQVGIAGSCTTGDYVVLAGQVGMKDHIRLHDRVIVGAQSGLMNDVPAGEVMLGSPATKQKEQMQIFAMQMRLPEMRKQLKALQATVDQWVEQSQSKQDRAA